MASRKGDWMQTFTGKQFWPLDPIAENVDILDIAHHLSMICRFSGACEHFYSVAQHSVLVSKITSKKYAFQGLFHDSSEAYMNDIIPQIKREISEISEIEKKIQQTIFKKFGIEDYNKKEIKRADKIALFTEKRDLMKLLPKKWEKEELYPPCEEKIIPLSPSEAEQLFLDRYHELKKE